MKTITAFSVFLLFYCAASADQITLKNGDRLTGAIVKNDGKTLTMKSELAGEVSVAWDAITAVSAAGPLHVGLKDGKIVVGAVTTAESGKLEIATKDAGVVTTDKGSECKDTSVVVEPPPPGAETRIKLGRR